MGKIKKILENELIGGTQSTDVYPVTSTKAVYDENNENLDSILNRRGVVNISTNYNSEHTAEVFTLEQAIAKIPSKDRVLGFQGKYLATDGWHTIIYTGDNITSWSDTTKWIDLPDKILRSISKNATFGGIAIPTTNPSTPDGPVFYIAKEVGTYSNFGGISVADGEVVILQWNDGAWTKKTTGFATEQEIIYDVSARNGGIVFESLSALLSSSDLNTLIPTSVRHGGMSIRFIQSSEQSSYKEYVQYRLTSTTWSTNVSDWQGVDDEPTVGSDNLVKSSGVANKLAELEFKKLDKAANPQKTVSENGAFLTNESGDVFLQFTEEGLDTPSVSLHMKNVILEDVKEDIKKNNIYKSIDEDIVSLVTNLDGDSAVSWSNKYGFDTTSVAPRLSQKILEFKKKDMEEWEKAKMGMFIHWSLCSLFEGYYTGDNGQGQTFDNFKLPNEMVPMTGCKITPEKYKTYAKQFTADKWNADEVVKMAYNAGCKYIVITLQHAEGFLLCASNNHDFDVTKTSARTTLVEELKSACDKYGLKFGFYFNQGWNQLCEGGFGTEQGKVYDYDPWTPEQHTAYYKKMSKLVVELIERYNPFEVWFDTHRDYIIPYMSYLAKYRETEFPNIITNDRLIPALGEGDFATGEGGFYSGSETLGHAEDCYKMQSGWIHTKNEDVKSASTLLLRYMLDSFARGHNVLLNFGPNADGSIPDEVKNTWNDIADFVAKYGTFEGTKGVYSKCMPQWGRAVAKGNTLKCYVMDGSSSISVDSINTKFLSDIYIYDADGNKTRADYQKVEDGIIINGIPDIIGWCTVVDVEFSNNIVCDDYVKVTDTLSILAFDTHSHGTIGGVTTTPKNPVLGAWNSGSITSRFKYFGETGAKSIQLIYTIGEPNATATIYDEELQMTQNIDIDGTSTIKVNLINGHIYTITLKRNQTFNINKIKFI